MSGFDHVHQKAATVVLLVTPEMKKVVEDALNQHGIEVVPETWGDDLPHEIDSYLSFGYSARRKS